MKIKLPIEVNLDRSQQKEITRSYLEYLLPYECEIKDNCGKRFWYQKTYDARGDKVISLEKIGEVTELEEAIIKILNHL